MKILQVVVIASTKLDLTTKDVDDIWVPMTTGRHYHERMISSNEG